MNLTMADQLAGLGPTKVKRQKVPAFRSKRTPTQRGHQPFSVSVKDTNLFFKNKHNMLMVTLILRNLYGELFVKRDRCSTPRQAEGVQHGFTNLPNGMEFHKKGQFLFCISFGLF